MKSSYARIYAVYFISLVTSHFVPLYLLKLTADKVTLPFTMAFSNTPGILR